MPGDAGDDERHGEGVEEDGAENAFATHVLVDEDGEQEADDEAAGDEQGAEDDDVLGRGHEAVIGEEAAVLRRPTQSSLGRRVELVNESRTVQSMQPI